jgi:hypothetical protein
MYKVILFLGIFQITIANDEVARIQEITGLAADIVQSCLARVLSASNHLEADWGRYYHVFPRLINRYNLKIGVEVGVSTGGHSEKILQLTQVTKLYSVDPYVPNPAGFANDSMECMDVLYTWVKMRLSRFTHRSMMIRAFSTDASLQFEPNSIDFIFIDGDHSYEAVKADLHCWYDKVRPGGIIAGDDYNTWPGVPQAVNEFFRGLKLTVYQDEEQPRIWWVIKR